IDVDVRIISATNQNPDERISKGHFRKDLYYRLNVFRIELPSLAQRSGDILYMLKVFTDGKSSLLSEQDKQLLTSYPWPGNVRELSNAASYINVMGEIPRYIANSQAELSLLDNLNFDSGSYMEIYCFLNCLATLEEHSDTTGREKIVQALDGSHIKISEYKVRKITEELLEKRYIGKTDAKRIFIMDSGRTLLLKLKEKINTI
ncbi:MAG: sigma 54-interacting transcriptional regulator, partial [Oscillospiraceae bacterium]